MIKTILSIFLFLHLTILVFAQSSFHLSKTYTIAQGQINQEITPSISLRNLTNKTIQIKWEVKKTNLSSGWQAVVCDYQCYTSLVESKVFSIKPNGVLHDFKVSFRPNGKEGIGNLEISFKEINNSSSFKTVTFSASANGGDINKPTKSTTAPKIYPNPAIQYISIKDVQSKVKVIEIYNVVGRKLQIINVSNQGQRFDISRLPRGLYMVRMLGSNGNIIRTQRISKYNP